jgi:hypothetical protein
MVTFCCRFVIIFFHFVSIVSTSLTFFPDFCHTGAQSDVFDLHRSSNVDRVQRRLRRHRLP